MISAVITTKDSERTLDKCLSSIPDWIEKIVVDNYSTDNTLLIAYKHTKNVFSCGNERSEQRNYGITKSRNKWILFLDSDMYLSDDLPFDMVVAVSEGKCEAFYIPEKIVGKGFWIKVRNFERGFYNGTVIDCVRLFKKGNVYFDKYLTGPEDWDFDRRLKVKKGMIKSCLYHDEGEFNLQKYLDKKAYYQTGLLNYVDKWGENDKTVRKQLGFWYRAIWIFIRKGWKMCFHPKLTIAMLYLKLKVGIQYGRKR